MKDLMQEAGLPEPAYSIEGMFTVSLQRPVKTSEKTVEEIKDNSPKVLDLSTPLANEEDKKKPSEKTSEKILKLIGEDSKITIEELSVKISKSTRAIELQLKKLKESKIISRIGPDKGGEWIINKK